MTDQTQETAGVIAFPPVLWAGAVGGAVLLGLILPLDILPPALTPVTTVIGAILFGTAGILGLSGILAFRAAGTHVEPHKPSLILVHAGPYRFTRNPMYLGLMTLHLSICLIASLDWGLLTLAGLALVLHYGVVLREERYLTARFGQPYTDYLARTRRWI